MSYARFNHRRGPRRTFSVRGQTLVEYALILAFIAVVAVTILASLGQNIKGSYTRITSALATAQASH
ncbi:MAG: Flp family type IVb pilin [Verrucomicrobiota bacterium]